ncbi:MAG: carboxypeptidase regulatory-like domain-containing protein [Planctomycetes bacterium]|nr:carboxypeptidase regulatory-like domain-containing protein [Planctomycetota bacterium]
MLAIAGLIALAAFGVREWLAGRVTLTFVRSGGAVPALALTVFSDRLTFTSPSPPLPLGQVEVASGHSVTLDRGLVPQRAVVRYAGDGVGTGVVFVELGRELAPIELVAPRAIRGRVGEPIGFWAFGWRCAGLRPVGGAEITAMAGGEHGIAIGTATADAEGNFELTGISPAAHPLSLRVRAPGHALAHVAVPGAGGEPVVAALEPTRALHGDVATPADFDPTTLWVLARGLPGVQARPARDGSFTLDNLPPSAEPRLLLFGLGDHYGCREVRAGRDEPVRLEVVVAGVVRGRVVDRETGAPIGGALVFPDDAPAVRSRADGGFELTRVLPGTVELTAQYEQPIKGRRRGKQRLGRQQIEVRGGETLADIVLQLE